MRYKRFLTFITVTLFVFGCIKNTNGLKQEDIEPLTSIFLSRHVMYNQFTDEISERTLNNYIKFLDPVKYYFYKSDIDSLMKNKDKIDDFVSVNDYSFIFQIEQIYKKRFDENMVIVNELLNTNFDFDKDESIITDSDKIEYSVTKDDMKERWRKNIKLQLLNYLIAEKDINKVKEKIKKKYLLIKKRVDETDNEKILSYFLNAFTMALDPHSNYLTQEEHEDFQISTNLKLEGIGVLLRSEDGFVIVESIMPGGPASKLPNELLLKPEDKIIAVTQEKGDPVDVIDMELRDVVNLIRGKKGTVVTLSVLRQAGENIKQERMLIPIVREEIKLEDKAAKSDVYPIKRGNSEIKIGYLLLPSFYMDFDAANMNDPNGRKSSRDIIIEINKMKEKGIDGMIIDLRGNPGGALSEAINIAGMFIDQGPIVQVLSGNNNIDVMDDKDPGVFYDGPIVILIDKFSASASEIFAGAIKDYRRGIIIGSSSTFGKGSVQSYNVLPGKNGAMKITTALFYQPAGSSNQLNGIEPDINIPDLNSAWDIGESKLQYPLKWEKINSTKFHVYNNYLNNNTIASLKNSSIERVDSNKEFSMLINKIKDLIIKRKEKSISLKEQSRIENAELKEIEQKEKQSRVEKNLIDEHDLFLKEALNVTYDYIKKLKTK